MSSEPEHLAEAHLLMGNPADAPFAPDGATHGTFVKVALQQRESKTT